MQYVKNSLTNLHLEYDLWSKELNYWRDEIKVLEKYLIELDYKNFTVNEGAAIEHFQNQFIQQKNVVHDLRHEVANNESILNGIESANGNLKFYDRLLAVHSTLREKINTGRKIYANLKEEFRNWLVKKV